MDEEEVARIRNEGVLEIKLENDLMDLDVLMAVARDIFPEGRLVMTLHPNKTGVRILSLASA